MNYFDDKIKFDIIPKLFNKINVKRVKSIANDDQLRNNISSFALPICTIDKADSDLQVKLDIDYQRCKLNKLVLTIGTEAEHDLLSIDKNNNYSFDEENFKLLCDATFINKLVKSINDKIKYEVETPVRDYQEYEATYGKVDRPHINVKKLLIGLISISLIIAIITIGSITYFTKHTFQQSETVAKDTNALVTPEIETKTEHDTATTETNSEETKQPETDIISEDNQTTEVDKETDEQPETDVKQEISEPDSSIEDSNNNDVIDDNSVDSSDTNSEIIDSSVEDTKEEINDNTSINFSDYTTMSLADLSQYDHKTTYIDIDNLLVYYIGNPDVYYSESERYCALRFVDSEGKDTQAHIWARYELFNTILQSSGYYSLSGTIYHDGSYDCTTFNYLTSYNEKTGYNEAEWKCQDSISIQFIMEINLWK